MSQGTIAKLTDKGFGFIRVDGEEQVEGKRTDIFFHLRDLQNVRFEDLQEGDRMEFDIENTEKGRNATNIKRL